MECRDEASRPHIGWTTRTGVRVGGELVHSHSQEGARITYRLNRIPEDVHFATKARECTYSQLLRAPDTGVALAGWCIIESGDAGKFGPVYVAKP